MKLKTLCVNQDVCTRIKTFQKQRSCFVFKGGFFWTISFQQRLILKRPVLGNFMKNKLGENRTVRPKHNTDLNPHSLRDAEYLHRNKTSSGHLLRSAASPLTSTHTSTHTTTHTSTHTVTRSLQLPLRQAGSRSWICSRDSHTGQQDSGGRGLLTRAAMIGWRRQTSANESRGRSFPP